LTFWGLKPGMTVVEVDPGVRGWWTEILAPYARATGGAYIAALPDRAQSGAAPESPDAAHAAFWKRVADKSVFGEVTMLRPGGFLAVEQHRAPEGADPRAGTGYVPESYVIEEARKAGFVLEARSEINANPKDTKDHPFGVWTLPPTRRSAPAGQPVNPNFDHAKYDAIGESDRMTSGLENRIETRPYEACVLPGPVGAFVRIYTITGVFAPRRAGVDGLQT
jgi:predicted methyltransferase